MAASVSPSSSVDVDVNVVPFIDLMSCLVAFLLVTAVWTNVAQLKVTPKGTGADGALLAPEQVQLSVLVARGSLWVGLSTGERRHLAADDFAGLGDALAAFRADPVLRGRADVELAAEDGVTYQAVISAMDRAIAAGFTDVGFVDPASLSTRFER